MTLKTQCFRKIAGVASPPHPMQFVIRSSYINLLSTPPTLDSFRVKNLSFGSSSSPLTKSCFCAWRSCTTSKKAQSKFGRLPQCSCSPNIFEEVLLEIGFIEERGNKEVPPLQFNPFDSIPFATLHFEIL